MTLDFLKLKELLAGIENELKFEESASDLEFEEVEHYGEWDGIEREFRSLAECRRWAVEICSTRVVAAVDGGQINPDRSFYPPVGFVQAAGFVNFHNGRYEKFQEAELVFPDFSGEESPRFEEMTSLRRFALECRMMKKIMTSFKDENLFILYDGSLIASFLTGLSPKIRREYIENMNEVLSLSEKLRIPVIGYVDLSYARDLLNEIEKIKGRRIYGFDAMAVKGRLKKWGDSTPVFVAKREIMEEYSTKICYAYFLKSIKVPPSRVEFPEWMRDMKREVVDLVLSQCILGSGSYPYVLESADFLAHIGKRDRERFHAMVSKVLSGSRSSKSESKGLRRR